MTTKRIIILVILFVAPTSVTYTQTGCDPTWIHSYYVRGKEKVEDPEYNDNVFWCGRTAPVAGPLVLPYQHVARNICVREWQFLPETIKGITCLNFDFKATVNSALQDIINELHDCVCPTTGGLTISNSCENLNGAEAIEIFGTIDKRAFDNLARGIDGRDVPGKMGGRTPLTPVPSVWLNLSEDRKRDNPWCWQPECNNPSIGGKPCVSIKSVLLHEILHCLGLGHINGYGVGETSDPNDNPDAIGNPCENSTTYPESKSDPMYGNILKANIPQATKLSCRNICALRKLYCPNEFTGKNRYSKINSLCCEPNLVESPKQLQSLSVYPSAPKDVVNIEITYDKPVHIQLFIRDLNGRIFHAEEFQYYDAVLTRSVPVSTFPVGYYIAFIRINNTLSTYPFTVVR